MRRRTPTVTVIGSVLLQVSVLFLFAWLVVSRNGVVVILLVLAGATWMVVLRPTSTQEVVEAPRAQVPDDPRPDGVSAWERARQRFGTVSAEYAAYECDPLAVLRRPALADVRVASTARFVDAFAEAMALETDEPPPENHRLAFGVAVDAAERAWRAARMTADRIHVALLSPDERATVDRVIKLLTTATRSDSDAERLAAYARARSELARLDAAGVVRLPAPARTALEEAARGELPPGAPAREGA